MEAFLISLSCVAPMFCYLMLGYCTKLCRIVPDSAYSQISKLCFHVLMPIMMFYNTHRISFHDASFTRLLAFCVLFLLVIFAVGMLVMWRVVPDAAKRGVMIQSLYRAGIAVVGIGLVEELTGSAGVAAMTMVIAVLTPLYNALSIVALELCRGEKVRVLSVLIAILKTPMVAGSLLGVLAALLGIAFPAPVELALGSISKTASVMILLALGGTFRFAGILTNGRYLLVSTALRLAIVPLFACMTAVALGFRGTDLAVILITFASPQASSTFPMTQVYGGDDELAGQLVVSTSILCSLTFLMYIFLLQVLGLL